MTQKTKEKFHARNMTTQNNAFAAAAESKEKNAAPWKNGRKWRGIWLGGAAMILIAGMLGGGCGRRTDESSSVDVDLAVDEMPVSQVESEDNWTYDGEAFETVFGGIKEDEGVIYNGGFVESSVFAGLNVNNGIEVFQATSEGNLVGCNGHDRLVWVETQKHYEDGESLDGGFYIRRGSFEYESYGGVTHTVARYVEVTDKSILETLQKQVDEEKAARERAKLEAEGEPFEVDAPIKALFGFSIGATPSSVNKALFKNPSEGPDMMSSAYAMSGKLATPFRHFDFAKLTFEPIPVLGGQHLSEVRLSVWNRPSLESPREYFEEITTIVAMLEKKFGIKFRKTSENMSNHLETCNLRYEWESEGGDDKIQQSITVYFSGRDMGVYFDSDFISAKEEKALKEAQKPAKFSADAGADLL